MPLRRPLIALILTAALAACVTPGAAPRAPTWARFTEATTADWLAIDPAWAAYQGAHRYDGRLPDWSETGLAAKASFLRGVIAGAASYPNLTGTERLERDTMIQVAKGQLFWLTVADQPHTNPAFYTGTLDPNVYLARDYAPREQRAAALAAFLEAVPTAAAQIDANLKGPLPPSFVRYGSSAFKGFAEFYRGDAPATFAGVGDAALQLRLRTAADRAGQAMTDLAKAIGQRGGAGGYALGAERFAQMLRDTEGVDVPLDELDAIGRADLARNQAALREACAKFAPGAAIPECFAKMDANKPVGGPVAEATRQIPRLTEFVRAKDLVTIPGTEQALVRQSPPYNAQNSAYIDPPGPYESGIPSIYYLSAGEPGWSAEKIAAFIPGKEELLFTTVHEVMPGHFVQFLHANRAKSFFNRLFVSYAFAEGWAHYSEEMMWDAGLGEGNPELRIGQLSKALLRDCRYLSAIGLHRGTMTVEQSRQLFLTECYQDEGTAEQQSRRGTYDPGYLNYTLGKLMIRRLRDDWLARNGGPARLKAFHDTFLGFGGPPIPLVRQAMLNEDAPRAVF